MNAPIGDDEFRKYAPRRIREQPADQTPLREPSAMREQASSADVEEELSISVDRRFGASEHSMSDMSRSRKGPTEMPPPRHFARERTWTFGRIAVVVASAAAAALVVVFAMPLWRGTDAASQQAAKPEQHAPVSAAVRDDKARETAAVEKTDNSRIPGKPIAVAAAGTEPVGLAQARQPVQPQQPPAPSRAQPVAQEAANTAPPVHGVSDHEIRFGIAAPFSGASKELGQHMKMGIEAAFDSANATGGINGRQLRLIAADDGYEPARTAEAMKTLYDKDQVFGVIGNVGTPTAAVALPYALDHKMPFFGAFTGSGLLRNDPPDRYAFNYRASYAEETAAVVRYLVKVQRLKPEQIAVFAQQDAYGDAGFAGVAGAIRSLGGDERKILRLNYTRNTVDVEEAVAQLQEHQKKSRVQISAVIMVPTYRAAARFIEKTRDLYPNMIYTSVSFVGSTALANELMLLGKKYATGVIVTQVVPAVDGHSSLALEYKSAVAKYFPGEAPDYVSFEGYVAAKILLEALKRNGPQVDPDRLVDTLENLHGLDIGLGTPVNFSRSEHQAVHKVWGSQLDDTGHYQPFELQ
jgi:ABC-type branched-subunit amino acid transport system substrate-binding protein